MSIPTEHDYIGLSSSSSSSSSTDCEELEKSNVLKLKETELRLGLPGSWSPERKAENGVSLFGKDLEDKNTIVAPLKIFVSGAKRGFSDTIDSSRKDKAVGPQPTKSFEEKKSTPAHGNGVSHASKAQVVGWPPIRSFRKNTLATNSSKNNETEGKSGAGSLYVKVSMDGAPYLRKVDLKTYTNYAELSSALEKMFSCFTIGQCTSDAGREGLSESHLMDLLNGSEYVLTYEDKDSDWMLVGDVPWEMFIDSCKRLRIMKSSEAIGLAPKALSKCKNQIVA
ncbi:PREDICTED: auxin-responsive protein IAA27-like [Nicotiana attenuata]|uniref:Auxin-responsive protein n=1 Tax=Nicotiana attenuata TaxID=49451 RepID=A0A314KZM5_NICAT|nr:PREDICTED: auxin-responsive protein IAA27-like [Nicotiana attenuata]OIT34174.1 auxin-responsive protein iaa27 [Nicotiana attenuata]